MHKGPNRNFSELIYESSRLWLATLTDGLLPTSASIIKGMPESLVGRRADCGGGGVHTAPTIAKAF